MTGFIERAGERAHERNMLDLENEKQRRISLAEFYKDWANNPSNKPWSQDLARQRLFQIQSTPMTKKLPKDIEDVQSLFSKNETYQVPTAMSGGETYKATGGPEAERVSSSKGGPVTMRNIPGSYTPEERMKMAAQAAGMTAGATAGAEAEATHPYEMAKAQAQLMGKIRDEYKTTGTFLLSKGIRTDSAGQPLNPNATYIYKEIYGQTQPSIIMVPEVFSNVQTEFRPGEGGTPEAARRFMVGSYGGRRNIQNTPGTVPLIPGTTGTESQMLEEADPFTPGVKQRQNLSNKQFLDLKPWDEGQPTAPPSYESPSGSTRLTVPDQRPTATMGATPAATTPPPTAPARNVQQGLQPRGLTALPRPAGMRRLVEMGEDFNSKDTLRDVEDLYTNPEDMKERFDSTMFEQLVNYYPSTHFEPLIRQLKPEMVPPNARGSLETIKDHIRAVLDNPGLWDNDDVYKGDTGVYIKNAMRALGIPTKAKESTDSTNKAAYAMTTLQAIRQMRQIVLKNPDMIGWISGRYSRVVGAVGKNPIESFVDKATRQEILTRLQYFVIMEAKVLMGSRPAVSWAKKLETVSAKPEQELAIFLGALRGAEQHAYNVLRESEAQRWGARWQEMEEIDSPFMPGAVMEGDVRMNPGHKPTGSLMTGRYEGEAVQNEWTSKYKNAKTSDFERAIVDPNTGDLWWGVPYDPATGQIDTSLDRIASGPYRGIERIYKGAPKKPQAPPRSQ